MQPILTILETEKKWFIDILKINIIKYISYLTISKFFNRVSNKSQSRKDLRLCKAKFLIDYYLIKVDVQNNL